MGVLHSLVVVGNRACRFGAAGLLAVLLGGCGGGGGDSSGNPTSPGGRLPLVFDIDEVRPGLDVVASTGEPVRFEIVLGPEQDRRKTRFAWIVDGKRQDATGPALDVDPEQLGAGRHGVEARIRDSHHEGSVSWRLQVASGSPRNRAPSILQAIPPGGRQVSAGEALTLSVLACDVDAADTLRYVWSLDGDPLSESGPEVEISTAGLDVGRHIVDVEVLDGVRRSAAQTTRATWAVDVLKKGSDPEAYITGAWPRGSPRVDAGGTVRFEVWAEAPRAEDRLSYIWEVDGAPQPATGPLFHFKPNVEEDDGLRDSYRVTCRLARGSGELPQKHVGWTVRMGPTLEAAVEDSATNRAPRFTSEGTEAPPLINAGDSRVFRVGVSDPDEDILTYRWLVDGYALPLDGPVLAFLPGMHLPGATAQEKAVGSSYEVKVVVDDGFSSGGAVSRSWSLPVRSPAYKAVTPAPQSITLDNGKTGTVPSGTWLVSGAGGYYGVNSVYSKESTASYVFKAAVPAPGKYDVLMWWTEYPSRSTAVPVKIRHAAGTATLSINQQILGSQWNRVGTYDFSTSAEVVVDAVGSSVSTCADAVCLSPVSLAPAVPDTGGAAPAGTEFVIDDGGAGTSYQGTWPASGAPNPYGGRSLYSKSAGTSYTFARAIEAPATYDVYAWWTEWSSRDPAAPYEIVHSGGTAKVAKDQRVDGGKWNLLGRYSFSSSVKVTLKVPSTYTVCADAVRFVPAGSSPAPAPSTNSEEIVVDDGAAGTTSVGTWSPSGAPNPYGGRSLYAKGQGSYTYAVRLPASGTYGLYVWYTEWPSRSQKVPYEVEHAGGITTFVMDQRTGGGKWRSLGNLSFGTTARVTIQVLDSDTVCADAVRFVPGGGAPPAETVAPPTDGTTPTAPADSAEIADLAAFALTPTTARVSWTTSFLANSVVDYGRSTSLGDGTKTVSGLRGRHSVLLSSLVANTTYYIRARSSDGTVAKSSDTVSFRTPPSSTTYTVAATRPRIYLTRDDVTAIRARIKTSPFSGWWSSLTSFASSKLQSTVESSLEEEPDRNIALAFAGLIGDVSSYRRRAIDVALALAARSDGGDNKEMRRRVEITVPVYDWLHEYLSEWERTSLRSELSRLATALDKLVRDDEYAVGHSSGNQSRAFLAALAIHGELSSGATIVNRALGRYNTGFWPFWREHGCEDGGNYKSAWYNTVGTGFNHDVFAAWKSATGQNLFKSETWFGGLDDWYLYSSRGDVSHTRHGDYVHLGGLSEQDRYVLLHVAREYGRGEAQWLADRIRTAFPVWGPRAVWEILWYDPSVASKAPAKPPSRHFRGPGMVFMLESWKDDSIRACFRAAPYYMNSHTHLDQCSFSIEYRGGQALDAGLYDDYDSSHWRNYYGRTIAHNAMLVHDPSESFVRYGQVVSADGGQYFITTSTSAYPRLIADLTTGTGFDLGGVTAHEDTPLYTYTLADGTRAYRSTKMARYLRHFLWIKSISGWTRPVIAVFDQVESTKSTFKKTYLLHTQTQPTVGADLVSARNGTGMIFQRTIYPASPAISVVGGSGKEYWVNGKNYPPARTPKAGEEPGAWRVEVSPTVARTQDEFLHLLYPAASGSSAPPSVRSIDAGSMKGFETGGFVVLFAVKASSVSSASYSLSSSRQNLLFGVKPGGTYDVIVGGARVATLKASVAGTLSFQNASTGTVQVVLR